MSTGKRQPLFLVAPVPAFASGFEHPFALPNAGQQSRTEGIDVRIDDRRWAGYLTEWRRHPDGSWWGRATAEWHGDQPRWFHQYHLRARAS